MSNEKMKESELYSEKLNQMLLDSRSILIYGAINQELAQKVSAQLLVLKALSDEPVNIYINSQGGHVEAGDTIHDMIQYVNLPVNMIGTGWVASAGITIYLAAEKEKRFSLPNTRFMIHQPSGGVSGQATDIEIEALEMERMKERINKLISEATGQPYETVAKDTDRNYWMSTEEALNYGVVGEVIKTVHDIA